MKTVIRPDNELTACNLEWCDRSPIAWRVVTIYTLIEEINQKNDPIVTTNILSLTNTDGVIPYSERGNQGNKAKENLTDYKVIYPNNIVANSMNILIGSVGISKYKGCVSPVYYVYRAKNNVDIRFVNYIFQTERFQQRLRQFANGILEIRLRLSSHDILHQKLALPDKHEQTRIADYLDDKVSTIDSIISEAQKSIEEYKELKQAIITEAVTKGLDENALMKDSGSPYIGVIPQRWSVDSLKRISTKTISYGVIKLFEPDDENGVKILRCSDVKDGYIDESNIRTITSSLSNQYSRTVLSAGDVVINVRGTLGGCAVIPAKMDGYNIAREVALISPNRSRFDSRFVMYSLLSENFIEYQKIFLSGAIYVGINMESLSHYKMAFPDKNGQMKIADFLDAKTNAINTLIAEKQSLIDDLQSYKKSLIYEIVTGKRKVVS
ncbi:MAG: restriction endonuclease subunit S [Erysipelotrichaceae bacterium]|jgi:type I restriction enzyme S subunit|nr:restriction endonuclease subunit S [Erysipelotrichaceae bacterium]MCH4045083.1 restriction endonuclease subunit S [Erysipelotrichaceae bacterium]MCH4122294.1 restriction endonuclease subunit S [Erysipelotrichaceae bacterium]MCI1462219.1 restriction endonuclease subunit S [Solobacterium sp.]